VLSLILVAAILVAIVMYDVSGTAAIFGTYIYAWRHICSARLPYLIDTKDVITSKPLPPADNPTAVK
jgi:hypothetical protein